MKKNHAHSSKNVTDVDLPPPTLSSGEGEEIPLDDKALEAGERSLDSPNSVESGSVASSKPGAGPATSTPWKLQSKSLKDRFDQLLSPTPRFVRSDGRLFNPRGFVGLSNENDPPVTSPPPGRFFAAFAIILAFLGVALLIAVVVYNTRHIDRLFQELEENKHNIVPHDVHDPIIEPLSPSAVKYVDWPLSRQNETPSKETSEEESDEDKMEGSDLVPKKTPIGKIAIPNVKFYLEPKFPATANDSNPINAVLTGTFGKVNGTFDFTKIGDIIHAHMRKKRQVTSLADRLVVANLKSMRNELKAQNEKIVTAMKKFDVKVEDISPTVINFDPSAMSLQQGVEFGKTILQHRDTLREQITFNMYIQRITSEGNVDHKALPLLVEKRQENINTIGEIDIIVQFLENGPGKFLKVEPETTELTSINSGKTAPNPSQTSSTPAESSSTTVGASSTPAETPSTPVGTPMTTPAGTHSTRSGIPLPPPGLPLLPDGTPSTPVVTPSTPDGTPSTLAVTPSTLAVTPSTLAVTPSTLAVTPSTLAVTPSTLAGTPSTLAGTPSTLAGTPSTLAGTPSTLAGTPSTPAGTLSTKSPSQNEVVRNTINAVNNVTMDIPKKKLPTSVNTSKTFSLAPMLEKEINLVHMGGKRVGGAAHSLWLPHSEVDLTSPDRSGKKAEIEKVELPENLQSVENATGGVARRRSPCRLDQKQCSLDGYCVPKQFWCNGKVHCPDSSDEISCSCRDRVDPDRVCDGYFDCPNGEDELGCLFCRSDEFNCGDFDYRGRSTCAPTTARCDGIRDCSTGKDEQSCSFLSDGILVGVPGQLAAVSMSQGVLHHNWHGHWLPVCWTVADIEWATAVCQEVVARNVTSYDVQLHRVRIPPNKYHGKWISLSNGVSVQDDCEYASHVTCPKIQPGTRVPPPNDPQESYWDTLSTSGTHFDELFDSFKRKVHELESLVEKEAAAHGLGINDVGGATLDELQDLEANLLSSFPSTYDQDDDVKRPQRMVGERVVGGNPARPGAWPWVVAIYRDGKFYCGGAVVNEYWILTAAHCVYEVEGHYMEVQAGMLRRSDFSPTEQIVSIDKVVINSRFSMASIQNDIAMVHVSPALKLNRWVRPVLLPSTIAELEDPNKLHITDPGPGHKCTVVGWGSTAEYGPAADNEREVEVPVGNCKNRNDKSGNDICAGVPEGGRDACQGDSGGPLLCSVPEQPSLWYAAGIVSHGEGCGRPSTPGAYTRVSNYADWIYNVMKNDRFAMFAEIRYPTHKCPGFHCESGTKRCIPKARRCDRSVDCLHADDEEECPWDMTRSFSQASNESDIFTGYSIFRPTTKNEPVESKAFHENVFEGIGTSAGTKADDIVNNVHNIVAAVSGTTAYPPSTTPKPNSLNRPIVTPKPVPTVLTPKPDVPIVFPGSEKEGPPPPLVEPLAPLPTEQVNPPPAFPTDGQNVIAPGSDVGKNITEAAVSSNEESASSESSSSESVEETVAAKPADPPKKPKPVKEPSPPITVIPVTTEPVPEPTVTPPFVPDLDLTKYFLCANARQKIIKERYCDGIADCMDNSDEINCSCRVKLQTLSPQAVCDGLTDCFDGSDEESCGKFNSRNDSLGRPQTLCPPGQIRCGLSIPPKCIIQSAECDGFENCPRGEDEEHCLALTDGVTVVLDRAGLPIIRREGVIARKKRGVWKAVCGLSKADQTARAWAFDACKDMGFNNWQSFNESSVADVDLTITKELFTPLLGPVPPASTPPPYTQLPNLSASQCPAINVRCSPNVDGNTDHFLVAKGVHEWPWFSELLVDGVSTCTGVLVHPNWIVTSYGCLKAVGFDIQINMLTALLGGSRSELGILEPNEQIRRADDIRLIPKTDILMVHLPVAFIETRHVRPTGLPDWFSMARKALTCVAVGRGLQGAWESMILQHEVTCDGEGLGKTCFTPLVPNAGCTTNVTTAPWSGALVCRSRKGWYPAAVYHEPYGRCSLAGLKAYDGVLYSLRSIQSLIDSPAVNGVAEPLCGGFRCPEGTCLPSHDACDGVPQCRDGSDENPLLCAALKKKCSSSNGLGCVCGPDEAQCGGGHGCIPLTSWCDGRPDCADGSDEGTSCGCADLLRVTRPHLLCDGRRHCDDYSDEDPAMCRCTADRFHCSRSGHCVSMDTVCDGHKDCPFGEDEAQCFSVRPFNAPSVSYTAFGEVVRRSFGLWHDMCAPSDPESQLNGATAACSAIGMTLLSYDVAPRSTDPTKSPLLLIDSSSDFVLTNRSIISLRGDRPLVEISVMTVAPGTCLALRVTCKY